MRRLLVQYALVLIEAAVVERLRRGGVVGLHPTLVHAPLVYDRAGRGELQRIYRGYISIARDAGLPLLVCAPTWRANRERVAPAAVPAEINQDAVRFLREVEESAGAGGPDIRIGGLIGCKNDCYRPEEGLTRKESESFHSWQTTRLAGAGVDFLIAETLPNVDEAVGIARAMAATGTPYIISFVINRAGAVLDGTDLLDAIRRVDDAVTERPLGFMVNCAHPSFLRAATQPPEVFDRLIGYQANASSLDHAELDGAADHHCDDVAEWGEAMLALNRDYGLRILGGCCGTGDDHLRYLAQHVNPF